MYPWHPLILIGLVAVAIPILIHLLNRSRARIVDWGAMRFLMASLASRSRRIMIEEIILMVLRCLVVALAVFAIARMYLTTRPTALAVLMGPAVVAAAICAALAAAMWGSRRLRRILLVAAIVLMLIPVVASGIEYAYQSSQWSFGGGQKDVAIVIDSSTSMSLRRDGKTNFERAVGEARAAVAACEHGDGISIILAGAAPRPVIAAPSADRREVAAALEELAPMGGSMRVRQALQMASHCLAEGSNPAKKIVLITDGQQVGWEVQKQSEWKSLAKALKSHREPPQIVVRILPLPRTFKNAAVADVALARKVVGTDRELKIDVKVESTGTEPAEPERIELLVDGEKVAENDIDRILPNAAETVHFKYRFDHPGRHVVAARVVCDDDLPDDNLEQRVVEVLDVLPVLIVDGRPSARPLEGAAEFIDIALAPPEDEATGGAPKRSRPRRADREACLVAPEVVAAPDLTKVEDFSGYALVVLAEVPRLPDDLAGVLDRFVRDGGGLLIAPGDSARAKFYNAWRSASGQAVVPGRLVKVRTAAETPARLAPDSFSHPALERIADPAQSDVRLALVSSYWQIEADEGALAGQLDTGEPLLAERKLGRGHVLLSAVAFHPRSCNLPALKCFVPLMHEIAYYLAGPAMTECNFESGSDVTIELRPAGRDRGAASGGLKGEYFADKTLSSPKLTRLDASVNFNWGSSAPDKALNADGFSVRWTGKVKPRYSGTYTFHTISDDGVRLWVDGKKIIDDWAARSAEERQGRIDLEADRSVDIRLEYFDESGEAMARLAWSSRRQKKEIIPPSRLQTDYSPPGQTALRKGLKVEVVTPSQRRRLATVTRAKAPLRIAFHQTQQPGLYRVVLPQAAAGRYGGLSPDGKGVPFVVVAPGGESTISVLENEDLDTARQHLLSVLTDAKPEWTLFRLESTGELTAAVGGGIPKRELWRFIALVLLGALLAEIALTRWIAMQRKAHTVRPVAFGTESVDIQSFRQRAEELLAEPAPQPDEAPGT